MKLWEAGFRVPRRTLLGFEGVTFLLLAALYLGFSHTGSPGLLLLYWSALVLSSGLWLALLWGRARDAGLSFWWLALLLVPWLNLGLILALHAIPRKR